MTREQMINTLALLGWEPVHVPGVQHALRKAGTDVIATASVDKSGEVRGGTGTGYVGVRGSQWVCITTEHMGLLMQEVMK